MSPPFVAVRVRSAFRVGGKVANAAATSASACARRDSSPCSTTPISPYRDASGSVSSRAPTTGRLDSDWQRLQALKLDGSVSASDEEQPEHSLLTARATAKPGSPARARANQAHYTVLLSSMGGVVTSLLFEVGISLRVRTAVFSIADADEPEIVSRHTSDRPG